MKRKIKELKNSEIINIQKELYTTHHTELQILEEAFNNEIKNLKDKWNSIYSEFEEKTTKQEEELNEKQEAEMKNCIDYIETGYPNIKFSSKFLDLRTMEANLVRQERYTLFNKIYRSASDSI